MDAINQEFVKPASLWGDLVRAAVPIAIVGAASTVYLIWGRPPESKTVPPTAPVVVEVETATAKPFSDPIKIVVDGVAQPHRHISVASEVSGRIKYKNPELDDGKFIRAGATLYEIDPADYESTVLRIQEELQQALNALKEWEVDRNNTAQQIALAEQDLEFAKREATRLNDLRLRKAASTAESEKVQRSEIAARVALQNSRNQLKSLDVRKAGTESERQLQVIALEQAQRDLERTKILSPVDAVVVSDNSEEGSYVQAGIVVAILNDVSRAEVGCQLELDDLFWVWKMGQPVSSSSQRIAVAGNVFDLQPIPATVEFEIADRICRWSGTLARFGGTGIDLSTRTIPCRVVVENPLAGEIRMSNGQPTSDMTPPPLSTGMFVRVEIQVQPGADLISLPTNSVRSGEVVWLVREGKLKIQSVKIARRLKEQVLVYANENGIRANDAVIISPLAVAQDGMLVKANDDQPTPTERQP